MKKTILLFIILIELIYANGNYYLQNSQKISLTAEPSSKENIDFYKNSKGVLVGITDLLIVKFKNNTNLEKYLLNFHLKLKKKLGKGVYLLQAGDKNMTLEIANTLSNYPDIIYAHPDFIKKRVLR